MYFQYLLVLKIEQPNPWKYVVCFICAFCFIFPNMNGKTLPFCSVPCTFTKFTCCSSTGLVLVREYFLPSPRSKYFCSLYDFSNLHIFRIIVTDKRAAGGNSSSTGNHNSNSGPIISPPTELDGAIPT